MFIVPIQVHAAAFDPEEDYKNLNVRFYNDEKPDQGFYINAASRYILETVTAPKMGSTYGEWSVMDLLRGMYTGYDYINYIPRNYFTTYKSGIDQYVKGLGCELDTSKSTEWSRLTLSMTSLGYDISNINGCNFLDRLAQSHEFSYRQGINGPIWEIIALDTGNYDLVKKPSTYKEGDINTKGRMLDYIIGLEIKGGGWALFGDTPDPDITGMALQALAPYYLNESTYKATDATTNYNSFKKAVERGIQALSDMQQPNGGFNAFGNLNAESTVQVVVALTALNIDPKSKTVPLPTLESKAKFNQQGSTRDGVYTDNMVDVLYTFFAPGSGSSPEVAGFKHVTSGYDGGGGSGNSVNAMATDQTLYGLIAYDRYVKNKNRLYDMTDMKNGEYQTMKAKKYTVTFKNGAETVTESYSPYALVSMKEKIGATNVLAWTTSETNSKTQYTANEKLVMPEKDITLYAKTDVKTFHIQYELNGGTLKNGVETFKDVDGATLPTAADVSKDGAQFAGWYTNASFTGNAVTTIAKNTTSDQTFYAKWIEQNAVSQTLVNLIKDLPTRITQQHIITVQNIRTMYNSLTEQEKLNVTNIGKLLDAEQQVIALQSTITTPNQTVPIVENDHESVSYLINQIPATITLDTQSTIAQARQAYDQLTIAEKRQVTNYTLLVRAEKAYETFVGKEVNQTVADRIIKEINNLPKIDALTLLDEEKLNVVRTAYDTITFAQQNLVTNYNQLVQLELKLKTLKSAQALKVEKLTNTMTKVKGQTAPNATVQIYRGKTLLGETTSASNGNFTITIPKQKATTVLKVMTNDNQIEITVKTSKTLPKPTSIKAKTTTVKGVSKKGYTVEVYKGNKRIGTSTVGAGNKFTVRITKQKKNTKLKLIVKDKMLNTSNYKMIKVK